MVLFAASWWILPAMGVIDLTVTWDEEWPVVLEAGWGVLFTGLGLSFLLSGVAPRIAPAARVHGYVVTATLLVAAVAGLEPETWWIFAMLAVQLPLLRLLARRSPILRRSVHPPMTALAVLAAPVGLVYAWSMADKNRQALPHGDLTNDVDHFSVQAALGLTLVLLPLAAALLPATRRLLGTVTALMAGYLGLVSYHWQGQHGGFDASWSVATMAWAAAVLVAAWWPAREQATTSETA
jgi:hypothetical protein